MSRLRQLNPQNYNTSGTISEEFENFVRYVNAAERGNKTLGELIAILFDDAGEFAGPIEFRLDSDTGLQVRIGTYIESEAGWQTLAALADLRGAPGSSLGTIGDPILTGRQDTAATGGQTEFEYGFDTADDLLVYVDGVLQAEGATADYTKDPSGGAGGGGSLTFNAALTGGELVSIFAIRSASDSGFTRVDFDVTANQAVFPFVFDANDRITLYRNGVLQQEGGANDYTAQPENNTITLNVTATNGDKISIVAIIQASQSVTGLMLEDEYVDIVTGLINLTKVNIPDDSITQNKVADLVDRLSVTPRLYVLGLDPQLSQVITTGDLWLDTSQLVDQLKIWTGTQWFRTSPESALPSFTATDALKLARVNASGTALEFSSQDLSSVIPLTQKGAANGVAVLDSQGRLYDEQLPTTISGATFDLYVPGAMVNDTIHYVKRVYQQDVLLTGISLVLDSGECKVQLRVDNVLIGDVHTVTSVPLDLTYADPFVIEDVTSSIIEFVVTEEALSNNLYFALSVVNSASSS